MRPAVRAVCYRSPSTPTHGGMSSAGTASARRAARSTRHSAQPAELARRCALSTETPRFTRRARAEPAMPAPRAAFRNRAAARRHLVDGQPVILQVPALLVQRMAGLVDGARQALRSHCTRWHGTLGVSSGCCSCCVLWPGLAIEHFTPCQEAHPLTAGKVDMKLSSTHEATHDGHATGSAARPAAARLCQIVLFEAGRHAHVRHMRAWTAAPRSACLARRGSYCHQWGGLKPACSKFQLAG